MTAVFCLIYSGSGPFHQLKPGLIYDSPFVFTDLQYAELVGHPPSKITKRAIVGTSKASPGSLWGKDIHVTTVPTFVAEIAAWLRPKHPLRDVIPENFPRLRALQFGIHYGSGS